jgi:CRISPR-associated protein Cas2
MLVLITYDVSTGDTAGRKRLTKVAKICVNYGQRVQNSVFECSLDATQLCMVRNKLLKVIDVSRDSLRIYNLGNHYDNRIEHHGVKVAYLPDDPMIL